MKLARKDSRSGLLSRRLAAALVAIGLVPIFVFAAAPSWWLRQAVVGSNATPDDYALVNQGQVKNMARAAMAELDPRLEGGAGAEVHALVNGWATITPQTNDFAPANLGQLKNVAKPFWDRLINKGFARQYPWNGSAPPADDFAIANIGQLKQLFSFDLTDTDQNGLADVWEIQYFGEVGVDPDGDADGDGLTNMQEFTAGSDPNDYYNGVLAEVAIISGGWAAGHH
jgi:hypothetical protein